jgi:hypothetical protein
MMNYPRSLLELGRVFKDDETCLRYMMQVRWPDGFVCWELRRRYC